MLNILPGLPIQACFLIHQRTPAAAATTTTPARTQTHPEKPPVSAGEDGSPVAAGAAEAVELGREVGGMEVSVGGTVFEGVMVGVAEGRAVAYRAKVGTAVRLLAAVGVGVPADDGLL